MATTPVRYKVPSAASNGSETFADQIVGFQITDGTSQLTNTNFAIDKVISEKDSRDFKTNPFSDFFKLDDLKKEENAPTTTEGTKSKDEKIKFRGDIADAGKSLYGSLKSRLGVSIANIINKFPASIYVDPTSVVRTNSNTAENVTYDSSNNITQFTVQASMFFNPFEITYVQPNSNTIPESINPIRNLYSSFKKYVLDFSGTTYNVISFSQPNANNVVTIKVLGKPFTGSTYTLPYNIRPNNGITEEFFNGLDELEQLLLNRESNPKYQASFKVPRESLDQSKYEISTYYINWPILQDNWNIQISGLDYEKYLYELSSLGDEIDDYKSNLIVRFLSAPQLFEFDTEDQKAQAIFQLYGQSFDRTKKYIDNIAHMRNVTYDGINNVPDILLKNLSETLGLDTHNLFDETSLEDILYTRQPNTYSGLTQGLTIIEAEYEMYRRLLINLAHIYKSKGTRNAIEFFLRFLGAPEPLIKIDEYVYDVVSSPTNRAFESDIQSLISGTKTEYLITGYTFSNTGLTYAGRTITKKTSLSRDEYPIDENGLPRKIFSTTDDIFFQKGAGWYEITKDHRASDIIDLQNSVLTGKTKIIKTIPKNFSYGEEYFDYFRKFPGLDYGFILSPRIDNLKSSNPTDENLEKLILNRKNLNVFLTPAKAIEYDVWRKSSSVKTFAQYVDDLLKENIKNSNSLKYDRHYLGLEKIYLDYINNTGITHYSYSKTNEFIDKLSSRWTKLIEQFIPATTLWLGGNLQSNLNMVRSKHQYKKPCQVYEITEDIHPGDDSNDRDSFFVDEITEIWNALSYASELDSSNGLVNNTQLEDGFMQFYPMFKIDGKIYSGGTVTGITYPHYDADGDGDIDNDPENYLALHALTGCTYALLSGTTNAITGITVNGVTKTVYKSVQLYSGDVEPPTLASLGPDYSSFKAMWKQAIENTVAYINIYSGYTGTTTLPFENNSVAKNTTYGNSIGNSTLTGKTTLPILSYEYITDINGIERIKFKSYKYGPHSCSVMKSFEFLVAYGTNAPDPTPTVTPTMTSTMTMTPTMTSTMTNTPTVTPTLTITPTLTTTPTLTPTTTPTKTIAGTSTPTPTMTPTGTLPLPGCGDIISNTFEPSSGTTQTQNLDLSEAANGSIVSMQYVANDRPNRFAIKEDGLSIVANSGWVGADSTYAGPWGGVGALSGTSSNGSATFTYYTGRSYQLIVDVGPANENGNPPNPSDSWTVTISCLGMPTPTPTNTMTVTPSPFFRYYKVQNCDDPSIIKYTVTYNNNAFTYGNRVYWGSTGITYTVIDTFDPATNTPPVPSYDLIQITRSLDPDTQIPLNNCPSDPAPAYRTAQIFAWTTSAGPYLTDIQAAACGKMPYTLDGYTPINGGSGGWVSDPAITAVTPSTVYTLYDANIGGNVINGGGKWHAVLFTGGGSVVQYIAYITTGGQIQDWTLCAPAVSPTQTPTLTQTPTVTPTLTQTPTSTPVFYWYELTYCDDPTIKGWSVPMSDGASIVGRLYQTGTNTYYTLGTYRNTTDSDPGNGAFGSKLSGTVLGANIDCADVGHAPPPPITELTLNDLTYDCTNSGTYKGKVYASWANGSGTYEVKAGFLGSGLSSYKSVGGNTSITISDPSNPYDGSTGIRNTTGGSDVFVVYVKDSGGVEKSKMISIGCSYAPPAPSPTSTPASTPAPSPAPPSGASGCATITTEYFYNDVECLGTNYSNGTTTTRFYATLDAISSVNVTIRLNATVSGCGYTTQPYDILIPAGTISNSVDITTYSTVDCNSNCVGESISIDSYESLTPNYTICT